MSLDYSAAIAANRFGLGARPGDLAAIGSDGRGWLEAQLHGAPPLLTDAGLRSTRDILADAAAVSEQIRAARRAASSSPEQVQTAVMRLPQLFRPIYLSEIQARLQRSTDTDRPWVERLVYFWSNHFAVSVDKLAVFGVAGSLEREAIRPRVLGNFRDLLLAVEQHPAMLLYLDNERSVGPNSELAQRAARRRRVLGLNENLAREILELHTLGVDAGYTQADVTGFAKVLTGWSLGGGEGAQRAGVAGEFLFRSNLHEPGAQSVFHRHYAQAGQQQGFAVLIDLAHAPATAHHIAVKLARHFIADDPPPAAVAHIERAFERSSGDLPQVYRALLECEDAWREPLAKYKTPQDYLFSICRGLQLPLAQTPRAVGAFDVLGQRQFAPGSPAGWPDRGDDWNGASALMKRIEFADALGQRLAGSRAALDLAPQLLGATFSDETRQSLSRAASDAQALTLLLTAPEFLRR
ncbi:MAG TPA: DUF1800 domain-containing protein [Steroidobacteraceae bacterium]|jgi:uncharacterized protein (DUF1800 family)